MMTAYIEMKKRHQEEFNALPIQFAFNDKQFAEGMHKLGLKPSDRNLVCSVFGAGDFIRKADQHLLADLLSRQKQELMDAIGADETGDGFIYQMFYYELGNHEYGYTGQASDTLEALGISWEDLENNDRLRHGFEKASQNYI